MDTFNQYLHYGRLSLVSTGKLHHEVTNERSGLYGQELNEIIFMKLHFAVYFPMYCTYNVMKWQN